MPNVTLITGGARSGKSTHALALAREYQGRRAFVATAEACDAEMGERIQKHRDQRGQGFLTIEEPLDPAKALTSLHADVEMAVVDCLTVWLGNLMHHGRDTSGDLQELADFLALLDAPPCDLVIVTNEVGMGIVPTDAPTRRFRDVAGWTNQKVAERADRVVLMISGIPVTVK